MKGFSSYTLLFQGHVPAHSGKHCHSPSYLWAPLKGSKAKIENNDSRNSHSVDFPTQAVSKANVSSSISSIFGIKNAPAVLVTSIWKQQGTRL